eukprot:TRINITY_DN6109_c0_g1_i1.p1 TRINITY_DN6109_c0_g1~~TRINITY_DN6109_c0_g1_i1.p1  ORF type:complete len:2348 (-),score=532.90 TRINITY_DN6109_c0_g1_i1:289-6285(-)
MGDVATSPRRRVSRKMSSPGSPGVYRAATLPVALETPTAASTGGQRAQEKQDAPEGARAPASAVATKGQRAQEKQAILNACRARADAAAGRGPAGGASSAASAENRSVEQTYQKKTQLEHILLRPDSYVGSMERQQQDQWVLGEVPAVDASGHEGVSAPTRRMVRKKIEFIPALYKVFDEIIVNAADHLIRDQSMDTIRVNISREKSEISVWNNGRGLPVEMHKEHKCYVPELVFGQLLTSDNYDDSEKKVVGGRNGYGAKLTNIFSKRFTVETADSSRGRKYKQTWECSMTKRNEPVLQPHEGEDFTCVTFQPDLELFGMKALDDDIIAVMCRRAYDVGASTRGRCKVYLDDELLAVSSFEDYVGLYLEEDSFRVVNTLTDRWEVAVALTDGGGFQQVSFVNSICTSRGGTHVNYIADQLVGPITDRLESRKKAEKGGHLAVKSQHIRGYLWVFVNCLIENPAFDSQTKDTLTSKKERFGSTCILPEDMINAVLESGVVDALVEWSRALGKSELAKHLNKGDYAMKSRLFGIPKLEDANKAGTKASQECTLIITEGDSAKSLAVAGLAIVGRDTYGVFPLRGKMRNVRELSIKQTMENKEIEQLMQILALDATKSYESSNGLRYGSLMIMTDQDFDGSHIKGLVINFIHRWFPGLLRVPGFMKEFVTPIVKATRGDEVRTFLTVPEYESWKKQNSDGKGWKCKYYKGLGTSTSQEAREYFSDLTAHELCFEHSGTDMDDDLIDMAFNAKRADDRKTWIANVEEGTYVDHSQATLSYSDFVNKELVLFARYDVERMIPSLVDGLKPGQRKVLFGCFKKNLTTDCKVAQLTGYVAEKSCYHHGEVSLQGTIIGMAQTYVGSNNINLLIPSGQFGTRIQGGKDHAAARYIFTRLSPVARRLFPEEDDRVLEYQSEEGISIEPKWFCPIIPLVLVNGAEGIGVGWSSSVPNYNPRDVIANIRRFLRNEELLPMMPWYHGFRGTIVPKKDGEKGKYESVGIAKKRGRTIVEITELSVRRWTQDYKEWLMEQLPQASEEKRALITEFRAHHTENTVHFVVHMTPDKLAQAERIGFERVFKLRGACSATNLVLFGADGVLRKFDSPEEILLEFAKVRLELYQKRKDYHIARMECEVAVATDKARFIRLYVTGKLQVDKRNAKAVCGDMRKHGLRTWRELQAIGPTGNAEAQKAAYAASVRAAQPSEPADNGAQGYGYCLRMKLWSLTEERLKELEDLVAARIAEAEALRKVTLAELWEKDLSSLEDALDQREAAELLDQQKADRLVQKARMAAGDDGNKDRQCVLVISKTSEIKRVRTGEWRARKMGGKGQALLAEKAKPAVAAKNRKRSGSDAGPPAASEAGEEAPAEEEAAVEQTGTAISKIFSCREFDGLLAFTEMGYVTVLQALDVPLRKRMQPGVALTEVLPGVGEGTEAGRRVVAVVAVPQEALQKAQRNDANAEGVVLMTRKGFAKRLPLSMLISKCGRGWCCAVPLEKGDQLCSAQRAMEKDVLMAASEQGMLLCLWAGSIQKVCSLKGRPKPTFKFPAGDKVCAVDVVRAEDVNVIPEEAKAVKRPARVDPFILFWRERGGKMLDARAEYAALSEDERQRFIVEAARQTKELALGSNGAGVDRSLGVDDDDSEPQAATDGVEPGGGPAEADEPPEVGDSEVEDEDDGAEEAGDGAAEEAPVATDVAVPAEANGTTDAVSQPSSKRPGDLPNGVCALLVTRSGMAKRVRVSDFQIRSGFAKRRGRGKLAINLLDAQDRVVGMRTVPGLEAKQAPKRPRDALAIYTEEHRLTNALETVAAVVGLTEQAPPSLVPGADPQAIAATQVVTETMVGVLPLPTVEPSVEAALPPTIDYASLFKALPEAERTSFEQRASAEAEAYAAAVEARRIQTEELAKELGQVLACSLKGQVTLVPVAQVPVGGRKVVGRRLMKLDGDHILSASIVSAVDEDDPLEEDAIAEAKAAAMAAVAEEATTNAVGAEPTRPADLADVAMPPAA